MNDLKPCPFCRSKKMETYNNEDYVFVHCLGCNARGSSVELNPESQSYQDGDIEKEENEAIKAWNTRHNPIDTLNTAIDSMQLVNKYESLLAFVENHAASSHPGCIKARELLKEIGELE